MNRLIIAVVALIGAMFSQLSSSQQIIEPEMTFHTWDGISAQNAEDGRVVRRIAAATIRSIRVEWPAGTSTIAHNHANELIVMLLEGRLRAFSGDREFLLEPGDMVVVPAYVEHRYEALEDSVTVEAVGPG